MTSHRQIVRSPRSWRRACWTLAAAELLTGCGRAPSFNILGSFFPAWLVCLISGVLLAALANRAFALVKLDQSIPWSIVVYPCLAFFFACTLWLIFFS